MINILKYVAIEELVHQVYRLPWREFFNKDAPIWCNRMLHIQGNSTPCCGYTPYNYKSHKCCSRIPKLQGNNNSCCGDAPYNYHTYVCCNGQVVNWDQNLACCDKKSFYSLSSDRCCWDNIYCNAIQDDVVLICFTITTSMHAVKNNSTPSGW